MKAIYKYASEITDEIEFVLNPPAELLSVQMQNDKLCFWFIVDTSNIREECMYIRKYRIIGTGWQLERIDRDKYITSVQQGPFVWHIFERN